MAPSHLTGYRLPVTKADCMAIGEALGRLRATVVACAPSGDDSAFAAHDRKLIYFAQLDAIDRVAMALASILDELCVRFDQIRFLRIVGVRR